MACYAEDNGNWWKLTSICEILIKKITMVKKLEDEIMDLLNKTLELVVKQ